MGEQRTKVGVALGSSARGYLVDLYEFGWASRCVRS